MKTFSRALSISLTTALLSASAVFAQTGNSPKLQVITPSENQTIYGTRVPILFSVQNFTLTDKQPASSQQANQGHILLWLDDKNASLETATVVATDSFTYSDVNYGDHSLTAELVTSDNKSLTPPQKATINFKNAEISSPTPAATEGFDKNTTMVILVVVALVIIAAWWYTREEDEEESPTQTSKPKPTKKTSKKTKSKPAKRK